MKNVKLIAILILLLAIGAAILQNTGPIRVRYLWFAVEMPTILLLLLTSGGGFFLGVLVALLVKGRKGKKGGEGA